MKTEEKKAGHTPGPWKIGKAPSPVYGSNGTPMDVRLMIWAENSARPVCHVGGSSDPHSYANARLIAAAPELLEALEGFAQLDWSKPQDAIGFNMILAVKAHAAIAKAKGDQDEK